MLQYTGSPASHLYGLYANTPEMKALIQLGSSSNDSEGGGGGRRGYLKCVCIESIDQLYNIINILQASLINSKVLIVIEGLSLLLQGLDCLCHVRNF